MLTAFAFWSEVSKIADLVSVIAFPLALLGLYLALDQLARTQSAVEAAEKARQDTERDSALRQLLVLVPSLAEVAEALETAVVEGDASAARRELANWRLRGSDVRGMLAGRSDLPEGLQPALSRAIVQAGAAKQRLLRDGVDIVEVTESARGEISESVTQLTELLGRVKAYRTTEDETDD